jgi:hypothetical protein
VLGEKSCRPALFVASMGTDALRHANLSDVSIAGILGRFRFNF